MVQLAQTMAQLVRIWGMRSWMWQPKAWPAQVPALPYLHMSVGKIIQMTETVASDRPHSAETVQLVQTMAQLERIWGMRSWT